MTMETSRPRQRFVDRFRHEVADGFFIGGALGSAYHFPKGGMQAVCKNFPRASCWVALFFGISEAIDCAMVAARGKEEPVLNRAVAMGGAMGIMDLPKGVRCAGQSALIGVALGGVVQGGLKLLQDRYPNVSPQAQKAAGPCSSCGSVFPETP